MIMQAMEDKPKSLFVDMDSRVRPIQTDDFLVSIGKKQSNTIYHVFSSTPKPSKYPGVTQYQVKVYVKSSIRCVYGLLTGRCDSPRALELMPKSFMFLTNFGACGIGFDNHSFDKGFKFTALEKYLVMVNREMHKKIIQYLKGEISEIELK